MAIHETQGIEFGVAWRTGGFMEIGDLEVHWIGGASAP